MTKFEKHLWSIVQRKGVSRQQKKGALKKLAEIQESRKTKK
tara:strand:- start:1700 stop:1822 length:123 start_codon:yes stop_codon:yes gene_type:complete